VSVRGDGETVAAGTVPDNGRGAHADVGAGVTAILQAAEDAADRIRAEAREQAADLIRQAEKAAHARLQELTRDADRVREEAEAEARDMRLAVEAYGTKRRREADAEAGDVVARAEARARELIAAAEAKARESGREAARRSEELRGQVRSLEARRERALDALRKIASHLDDALESSASDAGPPRERRRPALDEDLGAAARTSRPRPIR
jgi:cell division septum initiation protein DivIVA